MKITDVQTFPVVLERYKGEWTTEAIESMGFRFSADGDRISNVIIKLITNENIIGWGESHPVTFITGETQGSVLNTIRYLKTFLIGIDPTQISLISDKMDMAIAGNYNAKAAIIMALYDILGKSLNAPIYKLLGGLRRPEFIVRRSIGVPHLGSLKDKNYVDKFIQGAIQAAKSGTTEIPVKFGTTPSEDLERVRLVREAVGDKVHVSVDPNNYYDYKTCIRLIKAMNKYNIYYFEDPGYFGDIDGLAKVTKSVDTPIAIDMWLQRPEQVIRLVKMNAADILILKPVTKGGLSDAMKMASIAESAGLSYIIKAAAESRLGSTATAQFIASAKICPYDTAMGTSCLWVKEDIVSKGGIKFEGPVCKVPKEPGLGIEVNEEKLLSLKPNKLFGRSKR